MTKIDITERVLKTRAEKKEKERQREEELFSEMTMPQWMQAPFDEYFSEKESLSESNSNVITIDFNRPALEIPKALAASSVSKQKERWYDQGIIAFKDVSGAILNIIFNKTTDSNAIDITVTVTDGESEFLKPYSGLSKLQCSLFDHQTELATLTASVNHNGSFMFAEGVVLKDYEPSNNNDFISLRFHH